MTSENSQNVCIERFVVGPLQTNCYLVYEDTSGKGVLIDPGEYDERIAGYIKVKNIDIEYTINTHGHADHIAGDAAFGFPVLIHKADESCLFDPSKNLSNLMEGKLEPIKIERILSDGDIVKFGQTELEIIHTPGHTPGCISIKYDSILFSGDTLFYEGVGRTDLPGGSYEALEASIKNKLMCLPDEVRVFPGHGPETTIGHERKYNAFI